MWSEFVAWIGVWAAVCLLRGHGKPAVSKLFDGFDISSRTVIYSYQLPRRASGPQFWIIYPKHLQTELYKIVVVQSFSELWHPDTGMACHHSACSYLSGSETCHCLIDLMSRAKEKIAA